MTPDTVDSVLAVPLTVAALATPLLVVVVLVAWEVLRDWWHDRHTPQRRRAQALDALARIHERNTHP